MTDNSIIDHNAEAWSVWADEGLPDLARLAPIGTYRADAIITIADLAGELEDRLGRIGSDAAVAAFLNTDDHTDYCDRRATLRCLEWLDQLPTEPLPWGGPPPERGTRRRVLTAVEAGLVAHVALADPGRATVVGLLASGASSGEISQLTVAHLIPDDNGQVAQVRLPGTGPQGRPGFTRAKPRTVPVIDWARPVLSAVASNAPNDDMTLVATRAEAPDKIQSTIDMRARRVLEIAGLAADKTVKPMSIRNTAARHTHDHDGLEAAAKLVGYDDFNAAAEEIGVRSRRPSRS